MSVIVTAHYAGETFEVEIFRDGIIEFPGRDLQYEMAMAEFAPPGTAAVQLYEMCKKFTVPVTDVICGNLELPENSLVLIVTDYAEHVLHLYEDKYPNDTRPRVVIEATRDFVFGKIDQSTLEKARKSAEVVVREEWSAGAWISEAAARAAAKTASVAMMLPEKVEELVARAARAAAAHSVSDDFASVEWHQAYDAELAWQVRRFVDVMEAIGQGLPWPPLEATP